MAVGVAQDLVDGVELGLGPGEGGLHRGHSHYNITISAITIGSIDPRSCRGEAPRQSGSQAASHETAEARPGSTNQEAAGAASQWQPSTGTRRSGDLSPVIR